MSQKDRKERLRKRELKQAQRKKTLARKVDKVRAVEQEVSELEAQLAQVMIDREERQPEWLRALGPAQRASIVVGSYVRRLGDVNKAVADDEEILPDKRLHAVDACINALDSITEWTGRITTKHGPILAAEITEKQLAALPELLTHWEAIILGTRRLMGKEPETDEEMHVIYEDTRNEIRTLEASESEEIFAREDLTKHSELPWDRAKRELGKEAALDLRVLSDARRLRKLSNALDAAGLDSNEVRSFLKQLAAIHDEWLKLTKVHSGTDPVPPEYVVRVKAILSSMEDVIGRARVSLGMLPETDADRIANYEETRREMTNKASSGNGVLAEIGRMLHEIHSETLDLDSARLKDYIGFRPAFVGLCHTSDDQALMQLGVGLWNDTYRTKERVYAEDAIRDIVGKLYLPTAPLRRELAICVAEFAALWAHDAFQKVVTTHTYAAALMCTDANADALGDLHLPWRAFMIAIPDGLLSFEGVEGQKVHLRRALVHVEEDGRAVLIIYDPDMGSGASNMLLRCAPNLADLLFDPPIEITSADGAVKERSAETRAVRMVLRLVTGILVTLLYTQDYKKPKSKIYERGSARGDKRDPEHRVTFVGKPLKIDCRGEVKRFIAKPTASRDPKAPAIQYMVRGHQKRQVIGVGRTGRKVIWIQPYWRGDENAPILTKPRIV